MVAGDKTRSRMKNFGQYCGPPAEFEVEGFAAVHDDSHIIYSLFCQAIPAPSSEKVVGVNERMRRCIGANVVLQEVHKGARISIPHFEQRTPRWRSLQAGS